MKEEGNTLAELRQRGKKLGLSYAQTLSLLLFERILWEAGSLEIKDRLWLKEEEFRIQGRKKKQIPNEITYYMTDISYQLIQDTIRKLLDENRYDSVNWHLDFYDRELVVDLNLVLEQIPIAFKIRIRPVWRKGLTSEENYYQTVLLPQQEIAYQKYPVELDLVENIFYIMDRLELIGDMRTYGAVYQILRKLPLPGRYIYLNMREQLEESSMSEPGKRLETVLGYKTYGYMKKRWNRYRKECDDLDKEEDSWENVMDLLKECFLPVWEAIERDEIFIGDWMPQLGRYL